jgi:CRP-like cAMP-binding protein
MHPSVPAAAAKNQTHLQLAHPRRGPNLVCPDCAAPPSPAFERLLPTEQSACTLRCVSLAAREALPQRWFDAYAIGIVRRGVVVRQRVDRHGRAVAIDAVGPGGLVPLGNGRARGATSVAGGYAASDALVCLCPTEVMTGALDEHAPTAGDMLRLEEQARERIERIAEARGCADVSARFGTLLCALADTLSPGRRREVVPADLQQRDLASLIGVRHESVCRALGGLVKRGIVAREDDGIRLVDREQLGA